MSGTPGMRHSKGRHKAIRNQIWQSIRIIRTFTLADICRTVPEGAKYANVRKFVSNLHRHGYVSKAPGYTGGRAGSLQVYRLTNDVGPNYPTTCEICKENLNVAACISEEIKKQIEEEKQRKKETDKQTDRPTDQAAKGATS